MSTTEEASLGLHGLAQGHLQSSRLFATFVHMTSKCKGEDWATTVYWMLSVLEKHTALLYRNPGE